MEEGGSPQLEQKDDMEGVDVRKYHVEKAKGKQQQMHQMQSAPAPLTAQTLASAPPAKQKNMIGERLYPLIQAQQPQRAGKITGMLLEMDNGELLNLLESPDALKSKVQEAVWVLDQHATRASSGSDSSGSVPPGKRALRFKIPPNVSPGQTVTIEDKQTGKRHAVKIPANARAGSELQIFV